MRSADTGAQADTVGLDALKTAMRCVLEATLDPNTLHQHDALLNFQTSHCSSAAAYARSRLLIHYLAAGLRVFDEGRLLALSYTDSSRPETQKMLSHLIFWIEFKHVQWKCAK